MDARRTHIAMSRAHQQRSITESKQLYEHLYTDHFSFGKNWKKYLPLITGKTIKEARASLQVMGALSGKRFLDVGCGSGLFSLAAVQLGAKVVSIDPDQSSIYCTRALQRAHRISPRTWSIRQGSVLDKAFLRTLGTFDAVYAWGVLHHTGDMSRAFRNVKTLVRRNGRLYLAIYNKVLAFFPYGSSTFWRNVKRWYAKGNIVTRAVLKGGYVTTYFIGLLLRGRNPVTYVRTYDSHRGMNFWRDAEDWLGGYPYECATPQEIKSAFPEFSPCYETHAESLGCNEVVFKRRT